MTDSFFKLTAVIFLLISLSFSVTAAVTDAVTDVGETLVLSGPENLHCAAPGVWRSGQPSEEEFARMKKQGLRSVLNLRNHHSDRKILPDSGIVLYELQLNAGTLTEEDLLSAVGILVRAEKPVLVHCWHGSDRTGAVVAAYRIAVMKTPVEDAVKEMLTPKYGQHVRIYPNLPKLLRGIDWDAFRVQLNGTSK